MRKSLSGWRTTGFSKSTALPVACVALHVYPQDAAGELACLYVSKAHENQGYGRKLMAFAENLAREKGLKRLFALSTQAFSYLQQKGGFSETAPEALPRRTPPQIRSRADAIPRFSSSRWRRAAEAAQQGDGIELRQADLLLDGFVVFRLLRGQSSPSASTKGRGSKRSRELCGRRSEHSLVGGPGLDPCRRDQRGDISWALRVKATRSAILPTHSLRSGTILARVIIAYVFIKPYYDFRVVSIYEYLLLRFGKTHEEHRFGDLSDHPRSRKWNALLRRGHRLRHGL